VGERRDLAPPRPPLEQQPVSGRVPERLPNRTPSACATGVFRFSTASRRVLGRPDPVGRQGRHESRMLDLHDPTLTPLIPAPPRPWLMALRLALQGVDGLDCRVLRS